MSGVDAKLLAGTAALALLLWKILDGLRIHIALAYLVGLALLLVVLVRAMQFVRADLDGATKAVHGPPSNRFDRAMARIDPVAAAAAVASPRADRQDVPPDLVGTLQTRFERAVRSPEFFDAELRPVLLAIAADRVRLREARIPTIFDEPLGDELWRLLTTTQALPPTSAQLAGLVSGLERL